jgi:hypothetical protein
MLLGDDFELTTIPPIEIYQNTKRTSALPAESISGKHILKPLREANIPTKARTSTTSSGSMR